MSWSARYSQKYFFAQYSLKKCFFALLSSHAPWRRQGDSFCAFKPEFLNCPCARDIFKYHFVIQDSHPHHHINKLALSTPRFSNNQRQTCISGPATAIARMVSVPIADIIFLNFSDSISASRASFAIFSSFCSRTYFNSASRAFDNRLRSDSWQSKHRH